ncbi:MAG: HAD hydrolase-like protein [Lachnospiraceae bacterium]|nr:HAD hydrolase-like protein [Lachnospiraceae bacterium]
MADNFRKIKAVIFDLDDTLTSEYEYVASGYRFVSKLLTERLGHTSEEIEARLWELSKESYSHVFNRLFDSYGISYTEDELSRLITEYREHPPALKFYPDAEETLAALKDRGILTGIISDGDPERQRNKLRSAVTKMSPLSLHKAGIYSNENAQNTETSDLHKADETIGCWFDEIILNDEFGGAEFRKPNPKGFIEMAARLRIDPAEMIYIGDNPAKDFHIAAELPIRTARIIRENGIYTDREYLDGIRETWRIKKLTDVIPIVCEGGA